MSQRSAAEIRREIPEAIANVLADRVNQKRGGASDSDCTDSELYLMKLRRELAEAERREADRG